jgi:hypothetical protein
VKRSAQFLAWSVALTLAFYLLAYFLLPPPPPDASMTVLFAAIAMCIVACLHWILRRRGSKPAPAKKSARSAHKKAAHVLLLALLPLALLSGCPSRNDQPIAVIHRGPPPPAPPQPSSSPPRSPSLPPPSAAPSAPARRITGTALLSSNHHEETGYGLYSYVLLTHRPADSEKLRYRTLLTAVLGLPAASDVERYTPREHVNVTYLLVDSSPADWARESIDDRVDFLIAHYDYAHAAVIAATLPEAAGSGPGIVSYLQPISSSTNPHPTLYQDLSRAQPQLMSAYVQQFVDQASQEHYWQASAVADFALTLRNVLETAAAGLGMSKDAVQGWIKFFR